MSLKNSYTTKVARSLGFRSGFESNMGEFLKSEGIKFEYEGEGCCFNYLKPVTKGVLVDKLLQVIPLPKGHKVAQSCNYTVDFEVANWERGGCTYLETKGRFTASDRRKMELIRKQHPDLDIRMVFQSNGKVSPLKRYSDWCEERGIPFHVVKKVNKKSIYLPEDWLDEFSSNAPGA
jgi:hypothetical protein